MVCLGRLPAGSLGFLYSDRRVAAVQQGIDRVVLLNLGAPTIKANLGADGLVVRQDFDECLTKNLF